MNICIIWILQPNKYRVTKYYDIRNFKIIISVSMPI
jgi:hypothetical protein